MYMSKKTFVTKRFTFEACHFLPQHLGLCNRLHGHSYMMEITVSGEIKECGEEKGMIIDFSRLKDIINRNVVREFDHSKLNDSLDNPTAENLANYVFDVMDIILSALHVTLEKVRIWETRDSYAEVIRE